MVTQQATLAITGTIAATLKRSRRRRSIGIKVAHGQVIVSAPEVTPIADIRYFVAQKTRWIEKHLQRQQTGLQQYKQRNYLSGDSILWLGHELKLRVIVAATPTVHQYESILQLAVKENTLSARKQLLQRWYTQSAAEYLVQRVEYFQRLLEVKANGLKVRYYKSRWGSCNRRGELQFNWLLLMAPATVVDYVVVHELAHIKHFNHSTAFWQTVAQVMPNYQSHRDWLKQQSTLYW